MELLIFQRIVLRVSYYVRLGLLRVSYYIRLGLPRSCHQVKINHVRNLFREQLIKKKVRWALVKNGEPSDGLATLPPNEGKRMKTLEGSWKFVPCQKGGAVFGEPLSQPAIRRISCFPRRILP